MMNLLIKKKFIVVLIISLVYKHILFIFNFYNFVLIQIDLNY